MAISPQVKKLADVADRLGMYATDVIRFPELLKQYKLDGAKGLHTLATDADRYNREIMAGITQRCKQLNASRGFDAQVAQST